MSSPTHAGQIKQFCNLLAILNRHNQCSNAS
uniref:Uncharacterized protein n=1 Tax=Anguilla anguilla TaxID=7936 RepID=A0A0E9WE66_ANGAN